MSKFFKYLKESKEELAKVIWPSKKDVLRMSIAVAVVSLIVAFFLGIVDYFLLKLLDLIL